MMHWLDSLVTDVYGQACVLLCIVHTRGSSPRNSATHMIVSSDNSQGTIGGGHLEYQAISMAKEMLIADQPSMRIERFPLGARLGQCCGGVVHISFEFIPAVQPDWVTALFTLHRRGEPAILISQVPQRGLRELPQTGCDAKRKLVVSAQGHSHGSLANPDLNALAKAHASTLLHAPVGAGIHWQDPLLYEILPANDFHIAVFGAGHVGKALIELLSKLPCRVSWIDSRADEFPDNVATNIQIICSDHPEEEVDQLPECSLVVVMTHSHAMDQAICERALLRGDFAFCGLIGSLTKRRQFEKRLLSRGLSPVQWGGLTCPIGIGGINSKHPAQIAIAVTAQILQINDSLKSQNPEHESVQNTKSSQFAIARV